MENRKQYTHEELMQTLNVSHNDLPQELQDALAEFERVDNKVKGYQPELDSASAVIASEIREWYDEEEYEILPADANERAVYIAFYGAITEISPKQFKEMGGKVALNTKQNYSFGKFELEPTPCKCKHKIKNKEEEQS